MSSQPSIVLSDLCFAYGENLVLQDVSLEVKKGERVAIMGPSGSGKTSLLKAIAGFREFAPAQEARIHVSRFAFVFQQPLLLDYLSVKENICLPATLKNELPAIDEIVRLLDISELLYRYPYQLSGGQQRRVSLARALATPGIDGLIMDEPFTGLDEPLRERILDEIDSALSAKNLTCVIATHSPLEATVLGDRTAFLYGSPARIGGFHINQIPRARRSASLASREQFEEIAAIRRQIIDTQGNAT
jgi:ABC-type nitrate/sulfonate/bicarbonate transport system ATPase subunit